MIPSSCDFPVLAPKSETVSSPVWCYLAWSFYNAFPLSYKAFQGTYKTANEVVQARYLVLLTGKHLVGFQQ